jgi:hypothetical protein
LVISVSCVLLITACSIGTAPNSPTSSATPSSSAQPFQSGGTLGNLEACVLGHWIHSHEEDTPRIAIYRQREYEFPPARGRTRFDFMASGKATYYDIADSDGGQELSGRWEMQGNDEIKITFDDERIEPIVLHILTCDADRLAARS